MKRLLLPLLVASPALLGCATTSAEDRVEFPSIEGKYSEVAVAAPGSVGFLMTKLDQNVRSWNRLMVAQRTEEEDRKMRGLESWIRGQVRMHLDDVLGELESGPVNNRAVAAVALGFSDMEEAQSPLLAALDDREPTVVANALLGLGKLGMADTPLAQLCYHLRRGSDSGVRRNAAYALKCLAQAGATDECARDSLRGALVDEDPAVRGMAAVGLALIVDADSLQALGDLLYDEVDFVFAASATAIAEMALAEDRCKGEAARLLVGVFEEGDTGRRWRVQYELARLRGVDLGGDVEPWRDWAYKLP